VRKAWGRSCGCIAIEKQAEQQTNVRVAEKKKEEPNPSIYKNVQTKYKYRNE
jgi:hypothetical protein